MIDLHPESGRCQNSELANVLQTDPAYCHLTKLAAEMGSGGVAIRTLIAPAAKTCSQKIANLQAGIKVSVM